MLYPGNSTKGSYVEDWRQRLEAYIGSNYPGVKKMFTNEQDGPSGRKRYATPADEMNVVNPSTSSSLFSGLTTFISSAGLA